ncbi:hypothetical protein [Rhodococcus opacus]|uniref:hypothetical protein n=1 Tax=Rhodococcus opacus TaxID=37919 RepID=UPI001F53F96B|nr:hypothetical protein [Rhodococcus opacus]
MWHKGEVVDMLVDRDRARDSIHALSDPDLVELLVEEFSRRPALRPVRDDVTALLSMSPALARQRSVRSPTRPPRRCPARGSSRPC